MEISKIFGKEIIEDTVIGQLQNCLIENSIGVLTADAHYGYAMPVGGCIAYKDHISLSGVGYDIGCGNKAVKTNIKAEDIDITAIMARISQEIWFGVGRPNPTPVDHEILEKIANAAVKEQRSFHQMASEQLWTVGWWNHYVDIFSDEEGWVRIGVHFGSRGFGHKTTTGFIALSQGVSFDQKANPWAMDAKPILFDMRTYLGQAYFEAMSLAGEYAYAGRDIVCNKVLEILWAQSTQEVHNHHNFARKEHHFDEEYYVVRKWCTPAFPGQKGFVWSNMFDESVILEGIESEDSKQWLYSTVHWAGRVMSRMEAAGKTKIKNGERVVIKPGKVNFEHTKNEARKRWIILIGAWADESPQCYKKLEEVLSFHEDTVKIIHRLKPLGVAMAGADIFDPYKD